LGNTIHQLLEQPLAVTYFNNLCTDSELTHTPEVQKFPQHMQIDMQSLLIQPTGCLVQQEKKEHGERSILLPKGSSSIVPNLPQLWVFYQDSLITLQ
jgi:hypothetical protein